jgi:hypothetical protein
MRRLLLVLLAIPVLSGCGGGVDGSLFATAVRNTQEAGGAELAFQWELPVPGRTEPMILTGSGIEDLKEQRVQIHSQMPGVGNMELIADGLVMYIKFDVLSSQLGGKEWMKLDLKHAYDELGIDTGALGQVGQGTSEQLEVLGKLTDDGIANEGREDVRGTETTHYSATMDLSDYPDEELRKLMELTGQTEIPVDVWIDDDQRVRRMEWQQGFAKGQPMGKVVAEYLRFGVPVDIDVPDDDDVFDATELTIHALQQELN